MTLLFAYWGRIFNPQSDLHLRLIFAPRILKLLEGKSIDEIKMPARPLFPAIEDDLGRFLRCTT